MCQRRYAAYRWHRAIGIFSVVAQRGLSCDREILCAGTWATDGQCDSAESANLTNVSVTDMWFFFLCNLHFSKISLVSKAGFRGLSWKVENDIIQVV